MKGWEGRVLFLRKCENTLMEMVSGPSDYNPHWIALCRRVNFMVVNYMAIKRLLNIT